MNTELDRRIALLKHIAPHQSPPEREKMWDEILQMLLSSWSRYPQYNYNFSLAFDLLVPELSAAQRARIPNEIWETRLTPGNHYRLSWKYLPEDLFSLAWDRLKGIREDDIPSLIEHFVCYAPDNMISIIEPEVEKLYNNSYSTDRLPCIKAMLVRRNLRLSKAERETAYLELVSQHINQYQLLDLLDYIPQELISQVWRLKLADYRDFRSNQERRSASGPYRVEETLRFLIPRLPISSISQALDNLLMEVFQGNTLWESSLDPKTTHELSKDLLKRLPDSRQNDIAKEVIEKVEKQIRFILEHQPEQYYGSFPSLYGYLITFLDMDMQDQYWQTFFELTALLPNRPRQASVIIEHLEHYAATYRLDKWKEALQIARENQQDAEWVLNRIIGAIPLVFGEQPPGDHALASDIMELLLNKTFTISEYGSDEAWFGLALLIQDLENDTIKLLFEKYKTRKIKRVAACAFMPFLAPEQIDHLLVYRKEGAEGVMYMYNPGKEQIRQLSLVMQRWINSTALVVWKRSLDKLEHYISEHESNYHPDFFINWFRLLAATMPHYDVVAAWKKLLDHRKAFWFDAWQELGALLIDQLQPSGDEEAIRIIWKDIQALDIEKHTQTGWLQSAIAPKLPFDLINSQRIRLKEAILPPMDVFTCSLPIYIGYGGTGIKDDFEFRNSIRQRHEEAKHLNRATNFALQLLGILNSLAYPVIYTYKIANPVINPVFKVVLFLFALLIYPILFLLSKLERMNSRLSDIISIPFFLPQRISRGIGTLFEPVSQIIDTHRLSNKEAQQRFKDLIDRGSVEEIAASRPLLQRIGGQKLRYVAYQAFRDTVEWWANATIDKPQA